MIGRTISHYRVLKKIGKGGMGEVYLAEDARLGRKVALKFLPDDLQQDETARKRFLREAKSAAAIDHPYICKIYDVGEHQGQTLKESMTAGLLGLQEAVQIAREIAEALEEAHSRSIVHRDLKPSNIMLDRGGHAKVMDFGLAKRVASAAASQEDTLTSQTQIGSTMGTVPYMSPEQVRGEEVDTRSDIFSFGVIVYEMLAAIKCSREKEMTRWSFTTLPAFLPRGMKPNQRSMLWRSPTGRVWRIQIG